jgi:putative transposase
VTASCRVAKVSRSGYYAWASRPPSPRCIEDASLTEAIREIYRRSRSTYGAPRIHGQLCRSGTRVGRKRVARLMADAELVGVHSRKKWRRGRPDVAPAPDLLKRDFSASAPKERWVADITEFMTGEGKLCLAGVRDLYGRGLVGWSMGTRQTSELVIEAVSMAVARRDPDEDLVHHSAKGCRYTSLDFTNRLRDLGLVPSYGSTGDCYDNAAMETFWATLKRELSWIYGPLIYMNRARLRRVLFDYIEIFTTENEPKPDSAISVRLTTKPPSWWPDPYKPVSTEAGQLRLVFVGMVMAVLTLPIG